jgi:Uma2 family endonuclease
VTKRRVEGAPDLVVEVLSSGTELKDRNVKLLAYARFGVREVWLVEAARRRFEIYRLRDDKTYALIKTVGEDGTLTTPLLPGLRMKVTRLYR